MVSKLLQLFGLVPCLLGAYGVFAGLSAASMIITGISLGLILSGLILIGFGEALIRLEKIYQELARLSAEEAEAEARAKSKA